VIDAGSFTTRTAARTLLDAGADLEARGGVIGNGTPLADAVASGNGTPPAGWSNTAHPSTRSGPPDEPAEPRRG